MCGIYGYLGIQDHQLGEAMARSLQHRGPDQDGSFSDGALTLGIRRLSIVDPATGRQPISNEDQTVFVVCNGEIYNHVELREALQERGHVFRSGSDTEVIVHLYEEYGADMLEHLRGMFGLALWDAEQGTLLLARDRVGIKPLYYYLDGNVLVFASEIKAILQYRGFTPELNRDRLYAHSYFDYGDWTHIRQVREVMPGHAHTAVLDGNGVRMEKRCYWQAGYTADITDPDQAVEGIQRIMAEVIPQHLRSDVPCGFLISGGVDSNYVARMAREHINGDMRTFTFGSPVKNEFEDAGLMASIYQSDHQEILFAEQDVVQVFPRVMWALEASEPRLFDASIPTYMIFREIGKHRKVVLCGEGADELFGGYVKYFLPLYGDTPALMREFPRHVNSLYKLNLQRVDKISMAHSVEARVPLLDHHLIEWAARIHPQVKLHGGKDKFPLRSAAAAVLPERIAWRKKEQSNTGTGMPEIISGWIQKNISRKVLAGLPVRDLPPKKPGCWQPHSDEVYEKYNALLANLFYKQFVRREQVESIEDVLR